MEKGKPNQKDQETFIKEGKDKIRQMTQVAKDVTSGLGLTPEATFNVGAMIYGNQQPGKPNAEDSQPPQNQNTDNNT